MKRLIPLFSVVALLAALLAFSSATASAEPGDDCPDGWTEVTITDGSLYDNMDRNGCVPTDAGVPAADDFVACPGGLQASSSDGTDGATAQDLGHDARANGAGCVPESCPPGEGIDGTPFPTIAQWAAGETCAPASDTNTSPCLQQVQPYVLAFDVARCSTLNYDGTTGIDLLAYTDASLWLDGNAPATEVDCEPLAADITEAWTYTYGGVEEESWVVPATADLYCLEWAAGTPVDESPVPSAEQVNTEYFPSMATAGNYSAIRAFLLPVPNRDMPVSDQPENPTARAAWESEWDSIYAQNEWSVHVYMGLVPRGYTGFAWGVIPGERGEHNGDTFCGGPGYACPVAESVNGVVTEWFTAPDTLFGTATAPSALAELPAADTPGTTVAAAEGGCDWEGCPQGPSVVPGPPPCDLCISEPLLRTASDSVTPAPPGGPQAPPLPPETPTRHSG